MRSLTISAINSLKPFNILKKSKKHVSIPMELNDTMYKKMSEHSEAFDYLANRYKMDFDFVHVSDDIVRVSCGNNKKLGNMRGYTYILESDNFSEFARKIYSLADKILDACFTKTK